MSLSAIFRSEEILATEKQLIASGTSQLELITQMGLATAAQLRAMCQGKELIFAVCPGRKGAIALTAALELQHIDTDYNIRICIAKSRKNATLFNQLCERIPRALFIDQDELHPDLEGVLIDGLYGHDTSLASSQNAFLKHLASLPNRIIAIEMPSGVEANTGRRAACALQCTNTITFTAPMPCHMLLPARQLSGAIHVCSVGIDSERLANGKRPLFSCNTAPDFSRLLPQPHDNKFTRGAVAILASSHMPGAAYLAAAAARRCGVGAVYIITRPERQAYFQQLLPSTLVVACKSPCDTLDALRNSHITSLVIGPGLVEVLDDPGMLDQLLALDIPTLLDASALTALSPWKTPRVKRSAALVLTPHSGEFSRLFPELHELHPLAAVRQASKTSRATVLLKGYTSMIAAPNGRVVFTINAKPELGVIGSGDVLAGIIGALLAKLDDPLQAAAFGCWWHAAAGRGFGLVAEDIIEQLPKVAVLRLKSCS